MAQAKNFIVTGGGRGIGRGLSRLLLANGHRVLLLDNNSPELDHTSSLLSRQHGKGTDFEATTCNLRNPDDIREAVAKALKLFGNHLDCLVNNAAFTGGVGGAHLSDLSLEDWNASIETNLTAPMLMSQACLPMLKRSQTRQHGGSIIHISSTRASMSEPDNEPYSTTKAGLLGLTQSMAVSLAGERIRVNAILPGWIHAANECKEADEEGMRWADSLSEDDMRWHLTGRVGNVDDMLRAVLYLSDADGVTGTELVVDGGVSRKMVYPD
ncbi:NAD(P)-binding protein [Polychaeton citri CBS 116435]|uniref:NAD(P)-binding protein n=1 Tax=Polychaeton citri CBS 116435 TaxID=1314669 RepID=A0A9P4UUC8_9PEZI|nr:NAD(P)-binding protein [Polychaeton citri CBS 116435]